LARNFKYSAFISYSHSDQEIVRWLHRALEGYRLPKNLAGTETTDGVIPKKLKPFFRDRDDLSASTSLRNSVSKALSQSEFLIVICSPEAAKSEWVNKEILEFKKLREENNILCLIVGGTPNASRKDNDPQRQECFPPALRKLAGKKTFEPIAADARPEGDGKKLAKLKLIAGLLGLDLDKLVQRDSQRHQKRQAAVLGSSLIGLVILSVLLVFAIEARKDADEKRAQAENLVEFMIGDLNQKLAPTGSLQVMDSIAKRALDYYASLDPDELDDASLDSRSRVLLIIGGIEDARGNLDQAAEVFTEAHKTTEELLSRNPNNPDIIFGHSQSLYWLGYLDWRRGELDKAEESFRGYSHFAGRLIEIDPDNTIWQAEVGYAHSNLGTLYHSRGKFEESEKEFENALETFKFLSRKEPDSIDWQFELAQSYAWQADTKKALGDLKGAQMLRQSENSIYENLLARDQSNNAAKAALLATDRALAGLALDQGETEQAVEILVSGFDLGNELLALEPENTRWAFRLAVLYLDYTDILLMTGNAEGAKQSLGQAKSLTDFLTSKDSTVLEWRINANYRWFLLQAKLLMKEKDYKGALEAAEMLTEALDQARASNPENRDINARLIEGLFILSEIYKNIDRPDMQTSTLKTLLEVGENGENGVALKAQFLIAKAYQQLGKFDLAKQKSLYLDNLGYLNPEYVQFRKTFSEN